MYNIFTNDLKQLQFKINDKNYVISKNYITLTEDEYNIFKTKYANFIKLNEKTSTNPFGKLHIVKQKIEQETKAEAEQETKAEAEQETKAEAEAIVNNIKTRKRKVKNVSTDEK